MHGPYCLEVFTEYVVAQSISNVYWLQYIARNVKLKFALTMFNNIDIVIRFKKVHKDLGA